MLKPISTFWQKIQSGKLEMVMRFIPITNASQEAIL